MATLTIVSTDADADRLSELESVIDRYLTFFVAAGKALRTIRDERLYRETYSTFEAYCRDRWQFSKTHANRLIAVAAVDWTSAPSGVKPTCESQVRPLTKLPPEQQVEVWEEAASTAPGGKPTAQHVQSVVDRIKPKPEPPSKTPFWSLLHILGKMGDAGELLRSLDIGKYIQDGIATGNRDRHNNRDQCKRYAEIVGETIATLQYVHDWLSDPDDDPDAEEE